MPSTLEKSWCIVSTQQPISESNIIKPYPTKETFSSCTLFLIHASQPQRTAGSYGEYLLIGSQKNFGKCPSGHKQVKLSRDHPHLKCFKKNDIVIWKGFNFEISNQSPRYEQKNNSTARVLLQRHNLSGSSPFTSYWPLMDKVQSRDRPKDARTHYATVS